MARQVEKDLWLLTVEEVVRLRFLSTMVKLGRFFIPIQVDAREAFGSVLTWQVQIKPLRSQYLSIQRLEMPCFRGK
jgi:hypothetical protein